MLTQVQTRDPKQKIPRRDALAIARELVGSLEPFCDSLIVAGSLRRRKDYVGDVELLFVPKFANERDGLFETKKVNLVEIVLDRMVAQGTLDKRKNFIGRSTEGVPMWGPLNKLAIHTASGIPVDLFQTSQACWFNSVVVRTGSAGTNMRIAAAALRKGWHWRPYTSGFWDKEGALVPVRCEREVFEFVDLQYLEPWER